MKKDNSKLKGGKKMSIKGFSINGKLLEDTQKAIKIEDSDFSKYTRKALRERNKEILGNLEGE